MKINCIAVDDEPLALDIVEDFVSRIEFLTMVKRCSSALEAMEVLKTEKIDLIFLDIQMPELTGLEFLDTLSVKPAVIFTTAYENYAVESYEYNAVDYLMKPFSFKRFLKAVEKVLSIHENLSLTSAENFNRQEDFIFISTGGDSIKIQIADIKYIKGMSDYIMIYTEKKNHIVRDTLRRVEKLLSPWKFIRVHKSFIVPLDKISRVSVSEVVVLGEKIPIGNLYKKQFLNEIDKHKIG